MRGTEMQIQTADSVSETSTEFDSTIASLNETVAWLEKYYPRVAQFIPDLYAISNGDLQAKVKALHACAEFAEHGRGLQWATTIDQHLEVRKIGANKLLRTLQEVAGDSRHTSPEELFLLDVFGGAGFIAQFAREIYGLNGTVVTSDPSAVMVRLTLQKRLPALWQRAQDLFMTRSNVFDAVLFAYGTHHVLPAERQQCFNEAWRILKPNGALIFHDFENNTPTVRWFHDIVDTFTTTGHKHEHFATDDLDRYFRAAGFDVESITTMDDCFQFTASTPEGARIAAIDFMGGAYGLEKLQKTERASRFLWNEINNIFSVEEIGNGGGPGREFSTMIHRPALLGVGRKPIVN